MYLSPWKFLQNQILLDYLGRWRNQSCQIFFQSVHSSVSGKGSNFAIFSANRRWPLQLLYYRTTVMARSPKTSSSVFNQFKTTLLVSSFGRHLGRMPLRCCRHSADCWCRLSRRVSYKIALLTFKARKTSISSYLSAFLVPANSTGYSLHSSMRPLSRPLSVPRTRTVTASQGFSSIGRSLDL